MTRQTKGLLSLGNHPLSRTAPLNLPSQSNFLTGKLGNMISRFSSSKIPEWDTWGPPWHDLYFSWITLLNACSIRTQEVFIERLLCARHQRHKPSWDRWGPCLGRWCSSREKARAFPQDMGIATLSSPRLASPHAGMLLLPSDTNCRNPQGPRSTKHGKQWALPIMLKRPTWLFCDWNEGTKGSCRQLSNEVLFEGMDQKY